MVRVVQADRQQLEARRAEILARYDVTLDEFAERPQPMRSSVMSGMPGTSCAASPSCSMMSDPPAGEAGFREQFSRFDRMTDGATA